MEEMRNRGQAHKMETGALLSQRWALQNELKAEHLQASDSTAECQDLSASVAVDDISNRKESEKIATLPTRRTIIRAQRAKFDLLICLCSPFRITQHFFLCSVQSYLSSRAVTSFPFEEMADSGSVASASLSLSLFFLRFELEF
jgi:hypothetical protein